MVRDRAQLKQCIGVVFEEQNLYERLSAYNNLIFSSWLYGLPRSRVDEVLEIVQLRDRAKDKVSTFSNGMKQRLMIARALLHRPTVLFLDEPSRGLDPISAREIRQTIKQLCEEGMTILLTTHLMEEADQLCHQVAFIVNGHIAASDAPRNLKIAHGRHRLVVTLKEEETNIQKDHLILKESFISLDNTGDQEQLSRWIAQDRVVAIHSQEATLEEVFIKIAGIRLA